MNPQQLYEQAKQTTNLKERAELVVQAIRPLMSEKEIAEIAKQEDEYLRRRFSTASLGTKMSSAGYNKLVKGILLAEGKNAQQIAKLDAKGDVIGYELKHYFFKYCGLSKSKFYPVGKVSDEWQERNITTRILERAENSESYQLQPRGHIEKTYDLLESDSFPKLAAGLIAASGRRPHELFRAKFTAIEGENWAVTFKGQGKKRGEVPAFKIATLVESGYFISKYKKFKDNSEFKRILRETLADSDDKAMQNQAIDRLCNKRYNRIIGKSFEDLLNPRHTEHGNVDRNSCTDLRSAYLCLAVARDIKGSMSSQIIAAAKLAGHLIEGEQGQALSDRDLSKLTYSIGYGAYYVPDGVKVPFIEAPKKQKPSGKRKSVYIGYESEDSVAQFEQWSETWGVNAKDTFERVVALAKQQLEQQTTQEANPVNDTKVEALQQQLEDYQQSTDQKLNQLLEMVKNGTVVTEIKEVVKTPDKQHSRDWESVSRDELFGLGEYNKPSSGIGSAEERIRRSVEAVMAYNNQFPADADKEKKIVPNSQILRSISGSNARIIKKWCDAHEHYILDHLNKHELTKDGKQDNYHNSRYKPEPHNNPSILLDLIE